MKKLLKYSFLVLLLIYLTIMIVWSNVVASNEKCTKVDVEIINSDSTAFLTKEGILKELSNAGINPIGQYTKDINTDSIEHILNKFDYLEDAECVILNQSIVSIQVRQLIPVMRIFTPYGSFYVNHEGKKIKADARYHISVPIVVGEFNNYSLTFNDILPLVDYINQNPILSDYVTAINVKDKNNIYLIPNIKGHVISFGSATNIESKFQKITKFYDEVIPVKGWWAYDTISVKWDYQIVASRRFKEVGSNYDITENEDADDADISTMCVSENENVISSSNQDTHHPEQASQSQTKAASQPATEKKVETKPKAEDKAKKPESKPQAKTTSEKKSETKDQAKKSESKPQQAKTASDKKSEAKAKDKPKDKAADKKNKPEQKKESSKSQDKAKAKESTIDKKMKSTFKSNDSKAKSTAKEKDSNSSNKKNKAKI